MRKLLFALLSATLTAAALLAAPATASAATPTWHPSAASLPADSYVNELSCPLAGDCWGIDSSAGAVVHFSNGAWATPQPLTAGWLSGISCAAPTSCVAVGHERDADVGHAFILSGGSWTPNDPPAIGGLDTVSCASATWCYAGGSTGRARWNGTRWLTETTPISWGLSSCPRIGACVMVGTQQTGDQVHAFSTVLSSGVWSTPKDFTFWYDGGMTGLSGLSCRSTSFCVLAQYSTGEGSAVGFDGTTWSTWGQYDWQAPYMAVSCVSSTRCLLADAVGRVLTRTSSQRIVPKNDGLTALACAGSSFCLGTSYRGRTPV